MDSFTLSVLFACIALLLSLAYFAYDSFHRAKVAEAAAQKDAADSEAEKSRQFQKSKQKQKESSAHRSKPSSSTSASASSVSASSSGSVSSVDSHHSLFHLGVRGHSAPILSISYYSDSEKNYLFTSSADESVRLWDLNHVSSENKSVPFCRFAWKAETAQCVLIAQNAQYFIAATKNAKEIVVFTLSDKISKDTKAAASSSSSSVLLKKQLTIVNSFRSPFKDSAVNFLAASSSNSFLLLGSRSASDTTIHVVSFSGSSLSSVSINQISNLSFGLSALSTRFFAVGTKLTDVKVYELQRNKSNDALNKVSHAMTLKGHRKGISCLAIAANDEWIVSGSVDGSIRLWYINVRYSEKEDPKLISLFESPFPSIDFILWDSNISTFPLTNPSTKGFNASECLNSSFENKLIIVISGKTIAFVQLKNAEWKVLERIENAHKTAIQHAVIANDGKLLYTAAEEVNNVNVWKVPTSSLATAKK